MRKLTWRDALATLVAAAVVVPFVGYSVRGTMPFVQDPQGMSGVGIAGTLIILAALGRRAFGSGTFEVLLVGPGVATLAVGIVALVLETNWALLVPMMAGIVLVWGLAILHNASYLAPGRSIRHG